MLLGESLSLQRPSPGWGLRERVAIPLAGTPSGPSRQSRLNSRDSIAPLPHRCGLAWLVAF